MATLDQWLSFAPPARALQPGQSWNVFISYRSVERPWVIALYDILVQLGYKVFVDQFVLVAGCALAGSLQKNLAASQAGILVWSPASEDSQWCQSEFDAMIALEQQGGFRFCIARLGEAELPLFARARLWMDFSESRDGPNGTGLLSLLYGLHGSPQPPEAIALAAQVDEETRKSMARIAAAEDDRDLEGLLALGRSDSLAWHSSPQLSTRCAQALIAVGAPAQALPLIAQVLERFPRSLRARQIQGLALARSGDWRGAKSVLGELYELGERDPETVGIYARTWMDSYESTGNVLHLRRSRDLYAEAFSSAPSDAYVGINAAAKSLFLGEAEAAAQLAAKVLPLVQDRPGRQDYWALASLGEVLLIQGDFAAAGAAYLKAVSLAPGREGDHASTWKQAQRLLRCLRASEAQSAPVAQAFAHLATAP